MSSVLSFACTALLGTNKKGVIHPGPDGYYDMIVGGLNIYNSKGEFYIAKGCEHLFTEQSSALQRRIREGALRGEVGHPVREGWMSKDDFLDRVMEIRETNVCVHYRRIYLDMTTIKETNGLPRIAIRAELKPSGPHGEMLKNQLENSSENVAFSIRSFTERGTYNGQVTKILDTVITFDYVNEPGISIANKFDNPNLESLQEQAVVNAITPERLIRVCQRKANDRYASESGHRIAQQLLNHMQLKLQSGYHARLSTW